LHAILDKLLRKKHGAIYSLFWNSYLQILRQISEMRNQIVHWNAATFVGDNGFKEVGLIPPNVWDHGPNTPPPITTAELLDFEAKCDFLACLANIFGFVTNLQTAAKMDVMNVQTWHGIFLQPVTYPPPSTHPLCPKPQAPESQPPPSPA